VKTVAIIAISVGVVIAAIVGILIGIDEPQTPLEEIVPEKQSAIEKYFHSIQGDFNELYRFFLEMPKGGDLHNHLSGSVATENLIQIAIDENLCFDKDGYLSNHTDTGCPENTIPVSTVSNDKESYNLLIESWSMQNFKPIGNKTAHNHFFSTFDKFGLASHNNTATLGFWRITAENQKMTYMETMFNDPIAMKQIKDLHKEISITGNDFERAYSTLIDNTNIQDIAENSNKTITENYDAKSKEFCKNNSAYSCEIPFRYIFQIHRTHDLEDVFTQMVLGFETAKRSKLVTAINMVGAEDNDNSLKYYKTHMQMLAFLIPYYPDVNITLHAGELWITLDIPSSDMTFHVNDAITIGQAQRIGHGVDIRSELDVHPALLQTMKNTIPVEVPLTSNFVILEISVEDHPFPFFLENDVPVVLSTDDPGILRTNMTKEYAKAANLYQQLNFTDFKKIVRNGLEYSFLTGKSLWIDPGTYTKSLDKCGDNKENDCWNPKSDEKARIQFELEEKMEWFEEHYPK
jgi:adenosine deaminase